MIILPNGICNNPESVVENEKHKLLWDFEILTDHLFSDRRPDVVIVNNNNNNKNSTSRIVVYADPADHRVKLKESKNEDKKLDLAREMKSESETNCNWCARYSHQSVDKGTGGLGNVIYGNPF